jgi:hypothetical protein
LCMIGYDIQELDRMNLDLNILVQK